MNILRSATGLLAIVLLRFRPVVRAWAVLLVGVNLASVFFLDTVYGQVALAAACAGLAVMIWIYSQQGFVRLLGIGHVFWLPMLAWLFVEMPVESVPGALTTWLWCLLVCNSISLVIDALDVSRYLAGDREPYYVWD